MAEGLAPIIKSQSDRENIGPVPARSQGTAAAVWPRRPRPQTRRKNHEETLTCRRDGRRFHRCAAGRVRRYSEDPLLTGTLAAAITAGVQESGRHGVTLKHFACNNQEDNRMAVDARVSERALWEIYLRGFEIAVKTAAPAAVMSAYNCINGVHAANSRDLCTVVLRQEWGFAGLVMSDWNTTVPQDGSTPWRCTWAGNDVIMPGNPHDDQDIRAALADGRLPETAIRQSAARLIALASALRGG